MSNCIPFVQEISKDPRRLTCLLVKFSNNVLQHKLRCNLTIKDLSDLSGLSEQSCWDLFYSGFPIPLRVERGIGYIIVKNDRYSWPY